MRLPAEPGRQGAHRVQRFDYVIVGAGSSGCVLANRLSEDAAISVLLVETGPKDRSLFITMPRGFAKVMTDPNYSWIYPVKRGGGVNDPEFHLRGRTLGGSSSINGLVYMRGQASDYDDWGLPGWDWKAFLGAYRSIEAHELGEDETRGGKGPLKISTRPYNIPLCDAVLAGAAELGAPVRPDLNAQSGEAVGYSARNIWHGRRQSAAVAFLKPASSRPNLTVVTETTIDKITIEKGRAAGVTGRGPAGLVTYLADKGVILSAGAINTPKLLQLSGIGPGRLLRQHGVKPIVEAPEIGRNLSDHRCLFVKFRVNGGSDNHEFCGWRLYRNALQQILFGTGPLSRPSFEVGGYIRSDPALDAPDIRLLVNPVTLDPAAGPMKMERLPGLTIGGYPTLPKSRGYVEIASSHPDGKPIIVTNALEHEDDRRAATGLVRYVRRLARTAPLSRFDPREVYPGVEVETDEQILSVWARYSGSGMHISGTCRMGTDDTSVVDTSLRVRGVGSLFVVDISVLPSVISGNTNAPAMALGYLAADHIRRSEKEHFSVRAAASAA
jgi:choline dehydrogenase-like flavoprotein